jgi:hypothetical protein
MTIELDNLADQVTTESVKLITLTAWLDARYSADSAPTQTTVRRWIRQKRILPEPEKQGRAFFFHPAARYVAKSNEGRA